LLFLGLCGGCFSIAVPIFTSETAEADIRGGLGTFFDILMSAGMLYMYVQRTSNGSFI
jgi:hypothetical protein